MRKLGTNYDLYNSRAKLVVGFHKINNFHIRHSVRIAASIERIYCAGFCSLGFCFADLFVSLFATTINFYAFFLFSRAVHLNLCPLVDNVTVFSDSVI